MRFRISKLGPIVDSPELEKLVETDAGLLDLLANTLFDQLVINKEALRQPDNDELREHLHYVEEEAFDILDCLEQGGKVSDDAVSKAIHKVQEALNNLCPPYVYLDIRGLTLRVDVDLLGSDIACGEVVKIPIGDEWPELGDKVEFVLESDDESGRMALYDKSKHELWSID